MKQTVWGGEEKEEEEVVTFKNEKESIPFITNLKSKTKNKVMTSPASDSLRVIVT